MFIKKALLGLVISLLAAVSFAAPVLAFDPFEEACRDNPNNAVCTASVVDPVTGENSLVTKIANIIAAVGGVIAVIMIMVNGLTLITSNGDSAKLNKAREGLIYASIGIVIIVLARIIVAFIMGFL